MGVSVMGEMAHSPFAPCPQFLHPPFHSPSFAISSSAGLEQLRKVGVAVMAQPSELLRPLLVELPCGPMLGI